MYFFSMFLALIEFKGFLNSCEMVALRRDSYSAWFFSCWYIIVSEMSKIWIMDIFLFFRVISDNLNWMYWGLSKH